MLEFSDWVELSVNAVPVKLPGLTEDAFHISRIAERVANAFDDKLLRAPGRNAENEHTKST